MKVLFLIHTLGGGGAEKVLVNLVNNLDREKYDVTLMTIIDTGINRQNLASHVKYRSILKAPFGHKEEVNGKKVESGSLLSAGGFIKKMIAGTYSFIWKFIPTRLVYKIFVKEKYDVEVAFLEGITAKMVSSSSNPCSKKICWIHVDLLNERKSEKFFLSKGFEKKCYERFDQIVCVSNNVRGAFIEKFDFNQNNVLVRYNPIDVFEIIEKSRENVEIKKPERFLMVTIGRLIHQKGYDRLVKIAKKLIEGNFDFELWIIGDGMQRQELEAYISENNLQDNVKLLGFQDNPYKFLIKADLFVCSSYAEGFSTVASEAVVLGVPIVTVDCSGMKELLGDDDEYGIITKNDEISLFDGIQGLLNDQSKYDYYKNKVLERGEFFNLGKTVKEIEKLLD